MEISQQNKGKWIIYYIIQILIRLRECEHGKRAQRESDWEIES